MPALHQGENLNPALRFNARERKKACDWGNGKKSMLQQQRKTGWPNGTDICGNRRISERSFEEGTGSENVKYGQGRNRITLRGGAIEPSREPQDEGRDAIKKIKAA